VAVEPGSFRPQTAPLSQPAATTSSKEGNNKHPLKNLAGRPDLSTVGSSVVASSPLIEDERRAKSFKASVGKTPDRKELARLMGVPYDDKPSKTYLRGKVKAYVLRHIDMSKAFTEYDYADVLYPIIRSCTSYMNREILTPKQLEPWTKTITQHVIHAVFEDTRRNEGSKVVEAGKRKQKAMFAASEKRRQRAMLEVGINLPGSSSIYREMFPANMNLNINSSFYRCRQNLPQIPIAKYLRLPSHSSH